MCMRESEYVCVHECMFRVCVDTLYVSNVNIAMMHLVGSTTVPGREQSVECGNIVILCKD